LCETVVCTHPKALLELVEHHEVFMPCAVGIGDARMFDMYRASLCKQGLNRLERPSRSAVRVDAKVSVARRARRARRHGNVQATIHKPRSGVLRLERCRQPISTKSAREAAVPRTPVPAIPGLGLRAENWVPNVSYVVCRVPCALCAVSCVHSR